MTFGHYQFDSGASIHEHSQVQEEVWSVIEGELEVTIDGVGHTASAGMVAIVPSNTRHAVKALSSGRAIVMDHPLRSEFAAASEQ